MDARENANAAPSEGSAERLLDEIYRYLAVVDVFRALGCGPRWRAEQPVSDVVWRIRTCLWPIEPDGSWR